MKKLITMICFVWMLLSLQAQTKKDIFNSDVPITYYGIDFSNGHYYGDPGTVDASEMVSITNKINDLIIIESSKYNIPPAIRRSDIDKKIDLTNKLNASINTQKFIVFGKEDVRLNESAVQKIVSKYKVSGNGIGMVFIVELMDKSLQQTDVWVTFFSVNGKKVLLTEKVSGKAGGFGFRNYWARSYLEIIKNIKTNLYSRWSSSVE